MRLSYMFNFLAAVAVVGVLIFGSTDSRAAFHLMGASGAVSLSNSREGAAILSGSGLRPGARSSGSVTIGNPGAAETRLALDVTSEGETAGAGGARIWDTLRISISDGSRVVYEGRVADLGRLTLGALAAGGRRTYAVTATLPSGPNDNTLQGARLSLRFTWLAESTATATEPTPEPTPPPVAPPVTPGPATTTSGDPNATVTAKQLISMQAAKKCVRGRKLTVKFTPPAGVKVKSTATTVNRKKGASGKGAKTLTLRALPKKGAVKVSVTATLSTGRKVTLKRTFKTCGK
jgi:hypothetical protein